MLAGYSPDNGEIVYTADLLDQPSLARVTELKVDVNAGSIDMLRQLGTAS